MSELADALAQRTLALCRIASPIGSEQALADHVENWALGLFAREQVRRHGHSLVVGALDDARPRLLLVGHLDTVPAHEGDAPPKLEGGRVHGLGSSDMKGGLAVMMALAEHLPRERLPLDIVWVFYEREEGPYEESGLAVLLSREPALGRARLAVCLEPTDNVVQVGCVGSLHATLRFAGQRAHSARPWQGENAVHRAGPLLAELLARPRREVEQGGLAFYEVMSATRAAGGTARNVVPDRFELNVNYRFAPGKSVEQAEEELRAFVAGRAEVEVTDRAPSGKVCVDNPLFQRLLSLTGVRAESKQAWTDVARLSAHGVDAVNFGPGESAQAHQAQESAPVAALEVAFRVLDGFVRGA